jgi:hypothetical protein
MYFFETDMNTRDIPQYAWRETLDSFSRQHDGWVVSITTRPRHGDAVVTAREVPLEGVSVATPDSSDIAISVGSSTGHLTHEVHDVRSVKVELTEQQAERALIVQDGEGTTTTVAFRTAMPPEEVDGLPDYSSR